MSYGKALGILLVVAFIITGLWKFWDAAGDAREAEVRLEYSQGAIAAITNQVKNRKEAEAEKQSNTKRGEKAIEQTRNLDPDWSATRIPAGVYKVLERN